MECQVCTCDPLVKALAEITRTYTVTARQYDAPGSPRPVKSRELNPVETKIVRESPSPVCRFRPTLTSRRSGCSWSTSASWAPWRGSMSAA